MNNSQFSNAQNSVLSGNSHSLGSNPTGVSKNGRNIHVASPSKTEGIQNFIAYVISALAFVLPWIFTPFTYEYYEVTKNTVLIFGVILLLFLWAVKVTISKKFTFVKTFLNVPILVFLASQLLSTVFSFHRETSLWGYHSRLTGGFVSTLVLVLFFFIVVNNITSRKHVRLIMTSTLLSLILLALFVILKGLGVFQGVFELLAKSHPSLIFLNTSVFSPVGTPNSLPFLFIAILPAVLSFTKEENTQNVFRQILAIFACCILLIAIGMTSISTLGIYSIVIWGITFGIIVIFLVYNLVNKRNVFLEVCPVFLFAVFAAAFAMFPQIRTISKDLNFARYPVVSFDTTKSVVMGIFEEYKAKGVLIGTGPNTYVYNYPRFRPAEQNLQADWHQNYTYSSAEVIDLLANSGIVGLISFLVLGTVILWFIVKHLFKGRAGADNDMGFLPELALSVVVFLITTFVICVPITVSFIFWLFMALVLVSYYLNDTRLKEQIDFSLVVSKSKIAVENQKELFPQIFLVGSTVVLILVTFFISRNFTAELQYKKSLVAARFLALDEARINILSAIGKNDNRDYYHKQLAYIGLLALKQSMVNSDAEDEGYRAYQAGLVGLIKEQLNESIKLNPRNSSNWEAAAVIFKQLVDLSQGQLYGDETLQAASQAIALNPFNPDNYIILGYIYQYNSNSELSEQSGQVFLKAWQLRPDYPLAIFALGNYFEFTEQYDEARTLYQGSITNFYPTESQVYNFLAARIEAVDQKEQGLIEAEEQSVPTDEEITQGVEENVAPIPNPIDEMEQQDEREGGDNEE